MNSPTNGGARGTSVPEDPATFDLVAGDPQTIERVINMLCREFGFARGDHPTLRSVVEGIRFRGALPPDNRADVPQPPIALVAGGGPSNVFMIPMDLMTAPSAQDIARVCVGLAVFLLQKNKKYGDSALNPLRIFSKANPVEQIRVRIDDKLSRMFRGIGEDEDPLLDMTGYWVLLQVAEQRARDASEAEERGG